jgi:uncharacterized protein
MRSTLRVVVGVFDTRHAMAILDTLRSHYTRVRWSRPDTSQQPVSWKSPFFAQHMHNDLFDNNADSNVEKSLWTLVDSSRENPLVCYTLLDTAGLTWTHHVEPGRFVSLAAGRQKSMPSIKLPGGRNSARMSPCRACWWAKYCAAPMPTRASSASIRAKRPQLHNLVGEYNCSMRFEWDDDKQAANLRNHGLDLADAEVVFQHPRLTWLDTREDYGEDRWCSLGMLQGRVVVLVYTERLPDIIRVISLRKATHRERTQYDQFLQDRLGQG